MKQLVVLTYYRPHTSGLTIYAERLAKAMVRRGHTVTVLTSQYDPKLPREEIVEGVRIIRVPVMFRVSKGVIMPTFGFLSTRLVRENDSVLLHLPQFDAAGVALRGRLARKPTIITYHCDLRMPPGILSWVANQAVRVMNNLAAFFTHRIVTYTRDYAENSPFLRRYLGKLTCILPPVELPMASQVGVERFVRENNPQRHNPVVGMAARFATEKGVDVLLDAMPRLLEVFPNLQIQFAGPYMDIIGEEEYFARLSPRIEQYGRSGHWTFVGSLQPEQMACFYKNIDLLVLPSLNSTEAFGLVQIEAMMNGVPVVASNLPGVRQPVLMHGNGEIAKIGDPGSLAESIIKVLSAPEQYRGGAAMIADNYLPDKVAEAYETLIEEIKRKI